MKDKKAKAKEYLKLLEENQKLKNTITELNFNLGIAIESGETLLKENTKLKEGVRELKTILRIERENHKNKSQF